MRNSFCTKPDLPPTEMQLELIYLRCNKTLQKLYEKGELSIFYDSLNTAQLNNIHYFAAQF